MGEQRTADRCAPCTTLDPEQHAALTRLVDGLVARAGAQLAQAA
jgi:hypothetical protein